MPAQGGERATAGRRQGRRRWLGLALAVLLLPAAADGPAFDTDTLRVIEQRYGAAAVQRVRDWRQLIDTEQNQPLNVKLQAVNDFFNQLLFVDDIIHWKQSDYWATPVEFLGTAGGDCEDFAIAKYFTLRAAGIALDHLRLLYAKVLPGRMPHMVLAFYPTPHADPRILDNLTSRMKLLSQRDDLDPVYAFNEARVWLFRDDGTPADVCAAGTIVLWRTLLERVAQEEQPVGALA